MIAHYKSELAKAIRIEAHRASIVWRGMNNRVNKSDLVDVTLISGLALSLALLAWLVLR